jgi:hypothetical protein
MSFQARCPGVWPVRFAVDRKQLFHDTDQSPRGYRCPAFDAQCLTIDFIVHDQVSEWPAVVHRVPLEVQRPHAVEFFRHQQQLALTPEDPLLRFTLQIEQYGAIDPVYLLSIPAISIGMLPVKAFPKAPATALVNDVVEHSKHWRILGYPVHRGYVQRRPRETQNPSSFASGDVVIRHHTFQRCALGCRRHIFRDKTSLIAAFTRASSAYIFLRQLFSASRSLTRLNSFADMPAYALFHW